MNNRRRAKKIKAEMAGYATGKHFKYLPKHVVQIWVRMRRNKNRTIS